MGQIGHLIKRYPVLSSTNDEARALMGQRADEGTVVLTEYQTSGRGRRGRGWSAPPETSLLMSVILRPNGCLNAFQVTSLAAVSVAEAVDSVTDLVPKIKWPNDLWIDHRKFCGILIEGVFKEDCLVDCILGIGINVNLSSDEFSGSLQQTATSLSIETGHLIDREYLLKALLARLNANYSTILHDSFSQIFNAWKSRLLWIGEPVCISSEKEQVCGIAENVDEDGSFLIRISEQETRRFNSGDLSLRPVEKTGNKRAISQ